MAITATDAAFGEWKDSPIKWGTRGDQETSSADQGAIQIMSDIMETSGGASLFWELELERNVYGGAALKINPDVKSPGGIKWTRIPREGFFPVWDPEDPDTLIEVYVLLYMSAEQAKQKYGYTAGGDVVRYMEHWSKDKHETKLEDHELKDYSGINPYGVVPFVYTPRFRFSNWWGESMTQELIAVQDELNMRIADISDAINYNAHPVRWGVNLSRDFNSKNFPLGPNVLWNLGRVIGTGTPPEVGILEAKAAVQPGVFQHVQFLYDWATSAAEVPPIALGKEPGGGQRSGVTLELKMWPLMKAIRRSRAYLNTSMRRAMYITAAILKQKVLPSENFPVRALQSLMEGRIVPTYADIMPRDMSTEIDGVVKQMSTKPVPSISLETAQTVLGRGVGEVERIKKQLEDPFWKKAQESEQAASSPFGGKEPPSGQVPTGGQ
jgi:hypothetical protein